MSIITYQAVENKIITLRGLQVILDSDAAELYQIETKRINEAVKNNPEKFPDTYLMKMTQAEWVNLKSKFSTSNLQGGKRKIPTVFTEKGLYMLATILKGPVAIQTTLMIIDTFAKVRELGHITRQAQGLPEKSSKQKELMGRTGDLIADLITPIDNLEIVDTETTLEMNFAVFKIKRTVKKSNSKDK